MPIYQAVQRLVIYNVMFKIINRKYYFVASIIIVILLVILSAKPEYRWLLVNDTQAEEYALILLSGKRQPTPEWAYNLLIVKEGNMVTYSKHHTEMAVTYSQSSIPTNNIFTWSHAWGYWYIRTIKT